MSLSQPRRQGDDARPTDPAPGPVTDPKGSASPLDRASYARPLNRGYGDAMGRGLELALTLVVMVGIGWLIDRVAGTYPLFTIILSVVGFAGIGVKLWIGYDLEMRQHESGAVWNRSKAGEQERAA